MQQPDPPLPAKGSLNFTYDLFKDLVDGQPAVQESWLRLSRSDTSDVKNLGGWLTMVVSRTCLNMLGSCKSWREEPLEASVREPTDRIDPEQEAILADSVGLALLVVLASFLSDTLL
jgi:DNA-directed RNA polymerase specialized sigma24 family protein